MRARPRAGAAAAATFLLVVRAALVCDACGGGETVHRWATPQQEAEDERRDDEILRAVVSSMDAWSRRATARASSRRRERAAGVCYPEVGCFSDSGVFGYLDMLPSPPDEVGTRFLVWGSGGGIGEGAPGGGEPLLDVPFANYSRVLTLGLPFDPLLPTKIIVHGFGSSCSHVWVYEMRSALTAVEKCNVLCVDWEAGATVPNYVRAAANTRLVGKQLALLLRALADRTKQTLDPARVHIIGFSLGAHVAGFAGAEIRGLRRITGLDPAGPLFEGQDPRARLDATDANFVDVIHSNGESLVLGGLGSWQPMGHVDFYPNGGRMQKGCSNIFVGAVSDILWSASDVEGRSLCNHRRAYKFFTDSVSPRCQFPAFPCASYDDFLAGACFPCANERACGNMGYYADRSPGRGVLFLVTRDEEPFCAHQYFVRVESAAASDGRDASSGTSSYGSLDVTLAGDAGLNETFPLTTKRDEQLRPGQSLQRLVVPHPALATPARATLLYTAYAGWWSSGLPTWPVRKLSLVDSFGKSMSVCHNDELLLRSGEPMTLQLFPGECSTPPPANASTTPAPQHSDAPESASADAASSPEGDQDPPKKGEGAIESANSATGDAEAGAGVSEDALTALLAGAPVLRPWPAPSSEGESAGNSLEDGRAFRHPLPTPAVAVSTSAPVAAASTPLPDVEPPHPVREPVLTPRNASLGTRLVATEGSEEGPGASARRDVRVAGRYASEDDTRLWIPAADLNPPPLGGPPAWRHWTLARTAASTTGPSSLSSEAASRSGPTVQLLPQRLASLLSQAERAAMRGNTDDAGEVPNGPRQRRPKVFGAQSSSAASAAAPSPAPDPAPSPPPPALLLDSRGSDPRPLVALAHRDDDRFIPLSFPSDSPSAKRHAAIVTVTPERLRSGFRSVKIPRPDAEDARADDERRPVYRPAAPPPRSSDATRAR